MTINGKEALQQLKDGNKRFVSQQNCPNVTRFHQEDMSENQTPFAVVLACSDSRVPVEIIFDQGLGDLFVIRVAGNIANPSQIGSIEYATDQLGARVVVVLGHSHCGAIQAAIQEYQAPHPDLSPNLKSITDYIIPSIHHSLDSNQANNPEALAELVIDHNILVTTKHLRQDSRVIDQLAHDDGLLIVGAKYCLGKGVVEFFPLP
jgi:carbonic anhydrase